MTKKRKYIEECDLNHEAIRNAIGEMSQEQEEASGIDRQSIAIINFYDLAHKRTRYLVTNISSETLDKIVNN